MPVIKFTDIISYSSEDVNYPATNLLNQNGTKTWKCKSGISEKQHHVILKFDKLSTISSIDIGNEHSAFIEILVGREGVDYQVLLAASSFMTPLESKQSTNVRRVRMFDSEKLNRSVSEQKWDRIKVICTQPYNKSAQYGISFIVVNGKSLESSTDGTDGNDINSTVTESKLGKFTLKDTDSNDSPKSGTSLFSAVKESNPSIAASMKAFSKSFIEGKDNDSSKRKAEDISGDKSTAFYQLKKVKNDSSIESSEKPKSTMIAGSSMNKKNDTGIANKAKSTTHTVSEKSDAPKKASKINHSKDKSSEKSKASSNPLKAKPFKKLMTNVVFVLSGFQNPKRGQLRDKLCEMGAKYKGDWDRTCTHLICAFANTPKFQAVKGKGKIVKENWVIDCHKQEKRIPWRRYNMEKNKNEEESEEEICSLELLTKNANLKIADSDNTESDDSEDTDTEIQNALKADNKSQSLNGSKPVSKAIVNSEDEYEQNTDVDEEEDNSSVNQLPLLPNFFEGMSFFLYGFTDKKKKFTIERYIIAYKGKVSNYMSKESKYIITDGPWVMDYDEALNDLPELQFIKPQWIWKCSDKQKLVPYQPYLVVCEES